MKSINHRPEQTEAPAFGSAALVRAISRCALSLWRELDGATLETIKVRENAIVRATAASGAQYALRVHRPDYHSDRALNSELNWMQALREAGVATPNFVPTRTGAAFATSRHEGVRYQLDLFDWIDSTIPSVSLGGKGASTQAISAQYVMIGREMARMHRHAAAWRPPADFWRHSWDRDGLAGESPLWGRFWELELLAPHQRRLMERMRDQLRVELGQLGCESDRFGMIHADMMPDNVLIAGDTLHLIDFDDCGFGWYMFDVAVSLFSFSARADFAIIRDAFVGGYRAERPLSDDQLNLLALFLAARGACLLGWLHTRHPGCAVERAPWLIELACANAEQWLDGARA